MTHFPQVIWHGADYKPEQWLETPEIWAEDRRLIRATHLLALADSLAPRERVAAADWNFIAQEFRSRIAVGAQFFEGDAGTSL